VERIKLATLRGIIHKEMELENELKEKKKIDVAAITEIKKKYETQ
jgi:hypothetical protein